MTDEPNRRRPIVLSAATSIDGYLADEDGGVAWLSDFDGSGGGFEDFFARVDTLIMGRATYDQVLGFGPWPYEDKRTVILSSRPLDRLPDPPAAAGAEGDPPVEPVIERCEGDPVKVVERLRGGSATTPGGPSSQGRPSDACIWLVGGAETARQFLSAGLVDELHVAVIPILLGHGLRLFLPHETRKRLDFVESRPLGSGIVMLEYRNDR